MKILIKASGLVGLIALLTPIGALAQDHRSYVEIGLGGGGGQAALDGQNQAGALRDIDIDLADAERFDARLGLVMAAGGWGRTRAEVGVSTLQLGVEDLSLNQTAREVLDGSEIRANAAVVSLYYDTPPLFDRVRFSLGVGGGIAGIDHAVGYLVENADATDGLARIALPSSDTVGVFEASLGAELALTDRWSLTASVRRLESSGYAAERYILNTPGVGAGLNGTLDSVLDADFSSTTTNLGIRYRF